MSSSIMRRVAPLAGWTQEPASRTSSVTAHLGRSGCLAISNAPSADVPSISVFDAWLWTINDDLIIQVARSAFAETRLSSSPHFLLADLHGRPLHFAPASTLRPDPAYLAWHRRAIFAD